MSKKSCKNFKSRRKKYPRDFDLFKKESFLMQCSLAGLIHSGHSLPQKIEIISQALDISERTSRRWLTGNAEPHPTAVTLLFQRKQGIPLSDNWKGWRITRDALIKDTGESFTPDEIGWLWAWRNQKITMQSRINALQFTIRRLEKERNPANMLKLQQAADLLDDVLGNNEEIRRA